jgi:hypothetical protein
VEVRVLFGGAFLVSAVVCFANPTDTFAGLADVLGFLFLLVGVWWMVRAFLGDPPAARAPECLRHRTRRRPDLVPHTDPARTEQAARLVEREAQVGPAQLGQLARDPQPMQAERRLLASREHDPQLSRHPCEQQLQPGQRVLGAELVEIVDDQVERLLEPLELGQQPLDDRRAGARTRFGTGAWDAAAREGGALSFEDAIAYALGGLG